MKVDDSRWQWMAVTESGLMWMKMDKSRDKKCVKVDESWWKGMQVDESGWKRTKGDKVDKNWWK